MDPDAPRGRQARLLRPGRSAGAPTTLVGLGERRAAVEAALDDVDDGGARCVVIEGPAGIGKSTLAEVAVEAARRRGFSTCAGAAHELDTGLPFAPLVAALGLRRDHDDSDRAELGRLLRGRDAVAQDPAQRRWQMIDGIVDLLERLISGAPVLVLLEDLHWADDDTAAALARICRTIDRRLVVVVTARPLPRSVSVERAIASLLDGDALHVPLSPLRPAEVNDLAAAMLGAPPTGQLATALSQAGGNPLYVRSLIEAFQQDGAISVDDGHAHLLQDVLPPSLRMTIIRRLGFLSDDTLAVLRQAAVLGDSVPTAWLAAATGLDPQILAGRLDPAYRAGLLVPSEQTVTFRHGLIRNALYADMPRSARASLHAVAAAGLTQVGAPPADRAVHLLEQLNAGDGSAVDDLLAAAGALVEPAPARAGDLARAVLDHLKAADARRLSARILLARVAARTGRPDEAESLVHELDNQGLPIAERLSLWQVVTLARHLRGEHSGDGLTAYERLARSVAVGEQDRVRHLALIAFAWRWHDPDRAENIAAEVIAASPAEETRLLALVAQGLAAVLRNDVPAARRATATALSVARVGDLAATWVGVEAARMFAWVRTPDPDHIEEAATVLAEALQVATEQGLVHTLPRLHVEVAFGAQLLGDFDDAVAHAATALELMAETGYVQDEAEAHGILGDIALLAGRDDVFEEHESAIAAISGMEQRETSAVLASAFSRARQALLRGDPDAAWAHAGPAGEALLQSDPRLQVITGISSLPYVEAAMALGKVAAATAWVDHLSRWSSMWDSGVIMADVAARARVVVERTVEAAREAKEILNRSSVPPRLQGLLPIGEVLAEVGLRGEAVATLEEGLALAGQTGSTRVSARYERALRQLGVNPSSTRIDRPASGWEALTPAEERVVEFVCQGLTYREVGEALFVSRRTVETHVAAVFRKLGISSRRDLQRLHEARSTADED